MVFSPRSGFVPSAGFLAQDVPPATDPVSFWNSVTGLGSWDHLWFGDPVDLIAGVLLNAVDVAASGADAGGINSVLTTTALDIFPAASAWQVANNTAGDWQAGTDTLMVLIARTLDEESINDSIIHKFQTSSLSWNFAVTPTTLNIETRAAAGNRDLSITGSFRNREWFVIAIRYDATAGQLEVETNFGAITPSTIASEVLQVVGPATHGAGSGFTSGFMRYAVTAVKYGGVGGVNLTSLVSSIFTQIVDNTSIPGGGVDPPNLVVVQGDVVTVNGEVVIAPGV